MPKNIVITGKVVDKKDNLGLPGANCVLDFKINNNLIGGASDSNGNFRIKVLPNLPPNTYVLTVTYIGYKESQTSKIVTDDTTILDFGVIQLEETTEELAEFETITSKVKGKVVDNEDNPISGATLKSLLAGAVNKTTSESTGDFSLSLDYTQNQTPFDIDVFAEGFGSKSVTPFSIIPEIEEGKPTIFKNVIKNDLGIIKLQPLQVDLNEAIAEELPIPKPQVDAMKVSKINFEMAQQQAMNQVITTTKTVLLPAVLAQLAAFGIAKASDALNKKREDLNVTCPTNLDELNRLIEKRNKLVKALNNIYNFLNGVKIGVQIVDTTLTAAQIALEVLKALTFIPSTSVTPIPGSAATGVEKIERELKKYKLISSVTLMVLVILIQILERILALLALLDQVIGKCAIEGALPQEQLTNDLLLSTEFQSNQLSPVVTNVNGFEMGVITVDGETDNELKQRRAVARNAQGVIMLQGEPSYSSNDQILIDELVFYIQQNDLKAD
jgi:hypothetical protein